MTTVSIVLSSFRPGADEQEKKKDTEKDPSGLSLPPRLDQPPPSVSGSKQNQTGVGMTIWTHHLEQQPSADAQQQHVWKYSQFWEDDLLHLPKFQAVLKDLPFLRGVRVMEAPAASRKTKPLSPTTVQAVMDSIQAVTEEWTAALVNSSNGSTNTDLAAAMPTVELVEGGMSVIDNDLKARVDSVLSSHEPPLSASLKRALYFGWSCCSDSNMETGAMVVQRGPCLDRFLEMDTAATSAVHLWPEQCPAGATASSTTSLFGILSRHCQTSAGKSLLATWLQRPLTDLTALVQRQDAVEALVTNTSQRCELQTALKNCRDWKALAEKLGEYSQESEDKPSMAPQKALKTLYALYLVAEKQVPILAQTLQQTVETTSSQTDSVSSILLERAAADLAGATRDLEKCVALCDAVIDTDAAGTRNEYLIKHEFKAELKQIHEELEQFQVDLDSHHEQMNQEWKIMSAGTSSSTKDANPVRLEGDKDGNNDSTGNNSTYQFRLPNTNDSKVLQDCDNANLNITVHRILKNGVYFSTQELRQLSSQKQDLLAEYDHHQRQVVADAMKVAATYQPIIERACQAMALVDVFCSLAHVATHSPNGYCRPVMTDEDGEGAGLDLQGARHPCVELQETAVEYIPNDVHLIKGDSNFLLVTGPNMGGKSTYIRSVGAIVVMAQIGSYVPCTSAKMNICHHILARVGAGDYQERGISTFMAEMLEAASILRTATHRSLIIIDELGRGTSTFDGYGLARAISEYIVQKVGCLTVFATHFHELTALEEKERGVKNCHVTAQKGNQGLVFLYKVKEGPCLESFGIQVAEMANMPAAVIRDAKAKAKELEKFEYRGSGDSSDKEKSPTGLVDRFRALPLDSFETDEEKMAAVRQLLEAQ